VENKENYINNNIIYTLDIYTLENLKPNAILEPWIYIHIIYLFGLYY